MVKYRPNKGSLDEAKKNEREFNDLDEMYDYILLAWNNSDVKLFDKEDLSLSKDIGADNRIGWKETRYICVKRMGSQIYEIPQCIGMYSIE